MNSRQTNAKEPYAIKISLTVKKSIRGSVVKTRTFTPGSPGSILSEPIFIINLSHLSQIASGLVKVGVLQTYTDWASPNQLSVNAASTDRKTM